MDNVSGTAKAICDRNFRFECSKILEREGLKPSRYENLGFGCDFKEQAISYLKGFQGFFSQFRNNFATISQQFIQMKENWSKLVVWNKLTHCTETPVSIGRPDKDNQIVVKLIFIF